MFSRKKKEITGICGKKLNIDTSKGAKYNTILQLGILIHVKLTQMGGDTSSM